MSEINVTTDSTQAATGSVTDQISALLMEDQSPAPVEKKEPKAPTPKAPESKPDLPPSDDSMDSDDEGEGNDEEPDDDTSVDIDETDVSDEDTTWSKVLGVPEDKVILDEDGDFAGFKIKVDGKVEVVPTNDLIAGYQNNKSNTQKSKALAEERKVFESNINAAVQEYSAKIKDAVALTTYLETQIVKEYQGIDWNNLRYQNPGEYAALVQDYNIRVDEIAKIKDATQTVDNQEREKYQQQVGQNTQVYIQEQVQKAIENNPEWTDTKKFKTALAGMSEFVADYGFSPQEFAEVKDARILELIKDAQKYRSGKQVAEKKLSKPVAKFQKPTGKKQVTKTKLEQLTGKAKAATGYAKHSAETDAVAELLRNQFT